MKIDHFILSVLTAGNNHIKSFYPQLAQLPICCDATILCLLQSLREAEDGLRTSDETDEKHLL